MINYTDIAIGQTVKFRGNLAVGPCSGTVLAKYEPEPEEEFPGAVEMQPSPLPAKWPYSMTTFAPWIDELEKSG
jgi:hypothetical protein